LEAYFLWRRLYGYAAIPFVETPYLNAVFMPRGSPQPNAKKFRQQKIAEVND
jgi:hypothetical protein